MYKYRIKEFMDHLPFLEYRKLSTQLHRIIGVSRNTLNNYSNILIGSKKDIPYCTIRKLEIIFGMQYGGLINQNITASHYLEIIDRIPNRVIKRVRRRNVTVAMEQSAGE
jgi:hypothetical protein